MLEWKEAYVEKLRQFHEEVEECEKGVVILEEDSTVISNISGRRTPSINSESSTQPPQVLFQIGYAM